MDLIKLIITFILCGIVIEYGDSKIIFIAIVLTIIIVVCLLLLKFGGVGNDNKS